MSDERIHLGNHALTGQKIMVPFADLCRHWHLCGATGRGKSKAIEIIARAAIQYGKAVILLDGKGELYQNVLNFCVQEQLSDRVLVIDPQLADWAVGLNLLEPQAADVDAATHGELVMESVKRIFGQLGEFQPLIEKWLAATAEALISCGLTLAEVEEFASASPEPRLRRAVLHRLGDDAERVALRWSELESFRHSEQAMQMMGVQNRGAISTAGRMALAMFGQAKTTIDWRSVMDRGGIVLIRAYQTASVSQRLAQTIGVVVLQQLLQTARARPKDDCPDAFCICDEFQEFACPSFVRGLSQMRDRRLWFALSHQNLAQLEPVPGLLEAIETNCDGRLYFSLSHRDAALVVNDLFQHHLSQDHIRWISEQTRLDPQETTREIHSRSSSHVESSSDSFLGVDAWGNFDGSSGRTGADLTYSFGANRSHSDASGSSHGTADIEGETITTAPWYIYNRVLEETGRQFYSVADILERCKAWVMTQHVRRAYFQLSRALPALPIVTRFVHEPCVDPLYEVPAFLQRILPDCAQPVPEVLAGIEERRAALLLAYEEAVAEKVAQDLANPPRPSAAQVAERLRAKLVRRAAR